MPLNWGGMFSVYGEIPPDENRNIRAIINAVVDRIDEDLSRSGLAGISTIFTRPWSIAMAYDSEKYFVAFMKASGGRLEIKFDIASPERVPLESFKAHLKSEYDASVSFAFTHPKGVGIDNATIERISIEYLDQLTKELRFSMLGDLSGLEHLQGPVARFLEDHPDPAKNIFLMMRFMDTPQMREIHEALTSALNPHGYNLLRADDRAYTDELWSNIQVYIAGSSLGIAVFEDIERRDFNPNVALELGYMRAKGKRCLILKERRLPSMPSDIIHNLYREFDSYSITETIKQQIDQWVERDLPAR